MTARSPSACDSASAATTSRNSGSPIEPGSLVRSSTAIRRTAAGSASTSAWAGNGRYRRTCSTPTRAPPSLSASTVSRTVSAPEPMTTSTRSASGCPAYSTMCIEPAGARAELRHGLLDDVGDPGVEGVDRLARLEVDVGVLGRAADERALRRQAATAMCVHEALGHERPQVVVGEHLDRVELVRGSEAVEEVHERHPRAQGGGLRDERQVVGLLHRRRGEQREARLAHRHDV